MLLSLKKISTFIKKKICKKRNRGFETVKKKRSVQIHYHLPNGQHQTNHKSFYSR